jgi:hypothetical protein
MAHDLHFPHGTSPSAGVSEQRRDCAKIFAVVVFPVPSGPLKRYVEAVLLRRMFCKSVEQPPSCPIISPNFISIPAFYQQWLGLMQAFLSGMIYCRHSREGGNPVPESLF